jgi:hypothetical protein
VKKTIIAGAIFATTALGASAQDFYNGQPGPSSTQIDIRGQEDGLSTFIFKYFGKRSLVAVPFNNRGKNLGINFGKTYHLSTNNDAILALGLFRNEDGKYRTIDAQAYFTHVNEKWTTDLEVGLDVNNMKPRGSGTIGYGLTNRFRIGGSVSLSDGSPKAQAIARYDFPLKNGSRNWVELYGKEDTLGFRVAFNPKIQWRKY